MAKPEESELRIVEVTKPLALGQLPKPVRSLKRRSAPTRAEALKALQEAKGAAKVIERLPGLDHLELWTDVAYWSLSETKGAAAGGVFLWDCDFPGVLWNVFDSYVNHLAYFAGAENLGAVTPPQDLTGQVWCYLDAPYGGIYLFVAQVQTYPDDYFPPGYFACMECYIDGVSLGTRILQSGVAGNQSFMVSLSAGHHRFDIKQIQGGVFFESLSAWIIPINEP